MKNTVKFAAMALSAFVVALPAQASAFVSAAAKASASSAEGGGAAKAAESKKYCLNVTPDTATRMSKRQCKTKAEWADQGVELAPKK
jgi:hypothetical protein